MNNLWYVISESESGRNANFVVQAGNLDSALVKIRTWMKGNITGNQKVIHITRYFGDVVRLDTYVHRND